MSSADTAHCQWRPAEEAPKDGREVLILTARDEYRVCQWDNDFGWCDQDLNRFQAKLWVPLPPRPRAPRKTR